MHLNININSIANLKNSIGDNGPNIVKFSRYCENFGVDGIVAYYNMHSDLLSTYDIKNLKLHLSSRFILKIAPNEQAVQFALDLKPDTVCIVPDVDELSPSIGYDILKNQKFISDFVKQLKDKGILTSVFIEPKIEQVNSAYKANMDYVELNTANFSMNFNKDNYKQDYMNLKESAILATTLGMKVSLCKNIKYKNIKTLLQIPSLSDITMGHGILSKSIYIGIYNSIKEIRTIIDEK